MKILIAEDEMVARFLLANKLHQAGLEVIQASDGKQALVMLGRHAIDVLVTDLKMPVLDGFSLIKEVRQRSADRPHIFVFSGEFWSREKELLDLGVSELFCKPDGWRALIAAIKALK